MELDKQPTIREGVDTDTNFTGSVNIITLESNAVELSTLGIFLMGKQKK